MRISLQLYVGEDEEQDGRLKGNTRIQKLAADGMLQVFIIEI